MVWMGLEAGDQAVGTALAARGWAGAKNPRAQFIPRSACEGLTDRASAKAVPQRFVRTGTER